jgi:hypothetical protein
MKSLLRGRRFQDVPVIQKQSFTVFHAIPESQFLAAFPAVAEKLDLLSKLVRGQR